MLNPKTLTHSLTTGLLIIQSHHVLTTDLHIAHAHHMLTAQLHVAHTQHWLTCNTNSSQVHLSLIAGLLVTQAHQMLSTGVCVVQAHHILTTSQAYYWLTYKPCSPHGASTVWLGHATAAQELRRLSIATSTCGCPQGHWLLIQKEPADDSGHHLVHIMLAFGFTGDCQYM